MWWFDPEYNQIVNEDIIKAQYDCFASEVPGFKKSYEEFKKSYEEVERSYFETLRKYIIYDAIFLEDVLDEISTYGGFTETVGGGIS